MELKELVREIEKVYTTSAASERLRKEARGSYQRALAEGWCGWSGAGLRGEAKKWASQYSASRYNLLERGGCTLVPTSHGRLVAVTEEERDLLRENAAMIPTSWHIRKHWLSSSS